MPKTSYRFFRPDYPDLHDYVCQPTPAMLTATQNSKLGRLERVADIPSGLIPPQARPLTEALSNSSLTWGLSVNAAGRAELFVLGLETDRPHDTSRWYWSSNGTAAALPFWPMTLEHALELVRAR